MPCSKYLVTIALAVWLVALGGCAGGGAGYSPARLCDSFDPNDCATHR